MAYTFGTFLPIASLDIPDLNSEISVSESIPILFTLELPQLIQAIDFYSKGYTYGEMLTVSITDVVKKIYKLHSDFMNKLVVKWHRSMNDY